MVDFTVVFSAGCLLVGVVIIVLAWAVARLHVVHPRNPQLAIVRAHGIALIPTALYSLLVFCPIMDWLGSWSPSLAFVWFVLGTPIWVFCGALYYQSEYGVAINNLH